MKTMEAVASIAEVAFLAGHSDKDIFRLVNEHLLPEDLFTPAEHGRRKIAPLAAPFASFYYDMKEHFTAKARLDVIFDVVNRLRERPDFDSFLRLDKRVLRGFDWSADRGTYIVQLAPFVESASIRTGRLIRAKGRIAQDDRILGGAACFGGTRVPVVNVIASLNAGVALSALVEDYPFLTPELLEDAQVYVAAYPRVGRPRRMFDVESGMKLVSCEIVRHATQLRKAGSDV